MSEGDLLLGELSERKGFELDPFQVDACEVLASGNSVVVAAPTSAGKTVVAEYAVLRALKSEGRLFYTTPIKALSNQKFRQLCEEFGPANVGLMTGDSVVRPQASVVVMTTEVLRNMLYTASSGLNGLTAVVLDEVHYLMDPFRGPVWEEVMIHLDGEVQLVCLSATVSNSSELAGWLSEIHGPTIAVVSSERPVPLEHHVLLRDRRTKKTLSVDVLHKHRPNRRLREMLESRRGYAAPRRVPVVRYLDRHKLLPAIYFLFSRNGCDDAANACRDAGINLTSGREAERIREILVEKAAVLSEEDRKALEWQRWSDLLELGIASHHAGLVPLLKEAVEEAFGEGLIKVVFATETLAMGVNLPARAIVLESLSRFRGDGHVPLTPADYTQLTGRAGRRGIDEYGDALVVWSGYLDFDHLSTLAQAGDYVLESAFRPSYNMVTNLLRRSNRDEAHEVLGRSFAQYRGRKKLSKLNRQLSKAESELEELEAKCTPDVRQAVAKLSEHSASDAILGRTHGVLANLRPGDVVSAPNPGDPPWAVLSATRRASGYRVKLVNSDCDMATVWAADFMEVPYIVGELEMDYPFNPNDPDSQSDFADQLHDLGYTVSNSEAEIQRSAHRLVTITKKVRSLRTRRKAMAEDLVRSFDAIANLLSKRGYLVGDELTNKGNALTRVYHESDLLFCEAMFAGIFDDLTPAELAGLVSCFSYRSRGFPDKQDPYIPSKALRESFRSLEALQRSLNEDEKSRAIDPSNAVDAGFLATAHGWASGGDVRDVLEADELAGGDFVRTVRLVVDLLRHLSSIAPDPLATTARQALGALDRGLVKAVTIVDDEPVVAEA